MARGRCCRAFPAWKRYRRKRSGAARHAPIRNRGLDGDLSPHWDSYVPQILTWFPLEDGAVFLGKRGHPVPNPGERAIVCFATLTAEQTASEIGRTPEQQPQNGALIEDQLFPDRTRRLQCNADSVSVLNVEADTTLQLRRLTGGKRFSLAVPVQDGEIGCAAGTDRGRFFWLDANGWFPGNADGSLRWGRRCGASRSNGRRIVVSGDGGCTLIFQASGAAPGGIGHRGLPQLVQNPFVAQQKIDEMLVVYVADVHA